MLLSIVTAAHKNLPGLQDVYGQLECLLSDSCQWIVKDSGYCAETRKWLENLDNKNVLYSCDKDKGIYEALNFCIKKSSGDYYLVIGTDDKIHKNSLIKIIKNIKTQKYMNADFIVFSVQRLGKIVRPKKYIPISCSVMGLVSEHSLGTLIKKSTHAKFGLYDCSYKILADSLFIKIATIGGAKFYYDLDIVSGEFGINGISSKNHHLRIEEAFRYNVSSGSFKLIQFIYMLIRKIKYLLCS